MYFIISLAHTMRHEKYITLWKPYNRGYCYSKEMAGIYEIPESGYHDSDGNMPILITDADKLFEHLPYDGDLKLMIPNKKEVWDKIGVKMTRNGLVRTIPKREV